MWKRATLLAGCLLLIFGGVGLCCQGVGNRLEWVEPEDRSYRYDEDSVKFKKAKADYERDVTAAGSRATWPRWASGPLILGGLFLIACGCLGLGTILDGK